MAVAAFDGEAASAPEVRLFLGHPVGLGFLVGAEAWERFSYYGMQALLVLYMGHRLLLPGHVEYVAGFAAFRAGLERLYGPLSITALASVIFGLYAGGVYLTPLAGGWIADRWLGRTRTIVLGGALTTLGHFLMAFEVSFLPALACLLVGVGCFKGNMATQVGELYAPGDLRRADAFQVFILGINVAVIVSPLVCGTLGQKVAWHWGFGAAGVGMVAGLLTYLAGRRWLPAERRPSRATSSTPRARLAAGEAGTVLVLVALLVPLALASVGNMEIFNAYLLWGEAHYQLSIVGQTLPVTWLVSLDAFVSTGCLAAVIAFWRTWARFRREPDEAVKLAIGGFISALAPLMLALASGQEALTHHKVGLAWGLAFHVVNDIGFANLLPVGMALYSRAAPRAVAGVMMGVYYLNLFLANMIVGWAGGLLDRMAGGAFWLLHAALVGTGAVLILVFALVFRRRLAPTVEQA